MTKTKRTLIKSAAIAGLLAGSGAAIQASTVVATGKASFTSMQDTDKKDSTKVKEKHACKGQNSCKGKGGCKSGDNGCKGKNSCKGKAVAQPTAQRCPTRRKTSSYSHLTLSPQAEGRLVEACPSSGTELCNTVCRCISAPWRGRITSICGV